MARLAWPPGLARVLVLAVALASAEWLRGHVLTGFPWNVLGYALTWPLALMQAASVFGIYGLTLLRVAIFAAPLVLIAGAKPGAAAERVVLQALALAVVPLLMLYGLGAWRLAGEPTVMLERRASASCSRACRSARSGGRRSSARSSTIIWRCRAATPRAARTIWPASRT